MSSTHEATRRAISKSLDELLLDETLPREERRDAVRALKAADAAIKFLGDRHTPCWMVGEGLAHPAHQWATEFSGNRQNCPGFAQEAPAYDPATLPYRVFSAKVREDVPLTIALGDGNTQTTIHATGCADLDKAQFGTRPGFDPEEALLYSDDQYRVAPCARERNWSRAEKASRPDW